MSTEVEAIEHLHDAIFVGVLRIDAREELRFAASVVNVLLLVLADFDSNATPTYLHVNTAQNLAKSTSVDDLLHKIAITNLFANMSEIEAISTRYLTHAWHTITADRVDELISCQLSHLERGEFALVLLESLDWSEAL